MNARTAYELRRWAANLGPGEVMPLAPPDTSAADAREARVDARAAELLGQMPEVVQSACADCVRINDMAAALAIAVAEREAGYA